MPLSVKREDFADDWRFLDTVYRIVRAKGERQTGGKFDLDAFAEVLLPVEFHIVLILTFIAVWDNGGRFGDAVKSFEDQYGRLDSAFRDLGFNVASVIMPRALKLRSLQLPYLAEDLPVPADVEG